MEIWTYGKMTQLLIHSNFALYHHVYKSCVNGSARGNELIRYIPSPCQCGLIHGRITPDTLTILVMVSLLGAHVCGGYHCD